MTQAIQLTDEKISSKIYLLRGKRVMLDFDLAELYGVETKQLKRQVRRNLSRFPEDFMLQFTPEEYQILRSQFGTSSWGGSRYLPFAFTEQGVAMLSTVLISEAAIQVSIQIIRVFTRMREFLFENKDVFLKLANYEKKFLKHDKKLSKHEKEIQIIFNALKRLLNPSVEPRKRIGYRMTKDHD
jgi:hypothetical protein